MSRFTFTDSEILRSLLKLFFPFLLIACSKVNYYIYRANLSLENTRTDKAEYWYKKALQKDSLNFRANCEYGLMLGEWMNLHEKALPYLERAFYRMPKDTNWNLMHGLAKAYQHQEKYREARKILSYMTDMKTWDSEDKDELIRDIQKRISDCEWAIVQDSLNKAASAYVVINVGGKINSDKPEYVPLLTSSGDFYFTSKRKDADYEKFSLLDGKYNEAIYYTDKNAGQINRYVIPENNKRKLKRNRYHESLVSYSNDKKIFFYFQKGQLYEVHADSLKTNNPRKLSKTLNFEYYHNHAYLTRDGKTLYFTSESENGYGGLDIYRSVKGADETWAKAVNLGTVINTPFDEDAPYFDEANQILYFSSKGHPGYGFYDVYASRLEGDQFLPPVNLGRPVNSGGHDIFFTGTPYEFFLSSSSRKGGFGDMDIYKTWNTSDWEKRNCTQSQFPVSRFKDNSGNTVVELKVPFTIYKYSWKTEGHIMDSYPSRVVLESGKASGSIEWKAWAVEDTSLYPGIYCQRISLQEEVVTANEEKKESEEKNKEEFSELQGWISGNDLTTLTGVNASLIYFDFDSYRLSSDEKEKLQKLSAWLKKNAAQVGIIAYADDRGSDNYNLLLSGKRAAAIRNYLMRQGISQLDILQAEGKGKYPQKSMKYREQRVGEIRIKLKK